MTCDNCEKQTSVTYDTPDGSLCEDCWTELVEEELSADDIDFKNGGIIVEGGTL